MKQIILTIMLLGAAAGVSAMAAETATDAAPTASVSQPVLWASMSAEQQALLVQFESKWNDLPPQRQFALSRGAARWLRMNDGERNGARERFRKWRDLSEQRRKLIRTNWEDFQSLPPDEKVRIRQDFREYQRLSVERRATLRHQWQQLSRAERKELLRNARERRKPRNPR